MASCTFFGHRDCPASVKPALQEAIVHMICDCSVNHFYVGNHGVFDRLVFSTLHMVAEEFSSIRYEIVLAYPPQRENWRDEQWLSHTMLPEGIEQVPKRFAISYRNKWMVDHADYVIAAVDHHWGGAAQFVERAERRGKTVVHLLKPVIEEKKSVQTLTL